MQNLSDRQIVKLLHHNFTFWKIPEHSGEKWMSQRQIRKTIDSFNFSSRWHGPLCVNGVWTRAIWCYDLVVNGGLCWSLTLSEKQAYKAHEIEEDIWNPTSIDSMTMGFKESSSFHTCVETIHCLVEKTQCITKYYNDLVQNSIDVLMTEIG